MVSTRVSGKAPARKKARAKTRRTPVQRRSTDTVEVILQATLHILLQRGPGGLTTSGVATRAGVSVGSVYQYFPHKQALIDALMERHAAKMQPAIMAAIAAMDGLPLAEGVAVFARGLVALYRGDPAMAHMFHQLLPASPTSPMDAFEDALEREVAARLAAHPELALRDPRLAAAVLVRATGGFIRTTLRRTPEFVHSEAFASEVCALVLGYLRALGQVPRDMP